MTTRATACSLLATCLTVFVANPVRADNFPHYDCFEKASQRYQVDVKLLLAIATVESQFDMTATNINRNGTTDYGVMMINSHWEPKLEKLGIAWSEVQTSHCLNIHVGAWVLASNFARVGVNWYAVGAYNAGFGSSARTRNNRLRYVAKVHNALTTIESQNPELHSATADSKVDHNLPVASE